jgi:phasin family protein
MTLKGKAADPTAPSTLPAIIPPTGFDTQSFEKTVDSIKQGAESAAAGMEHVHTNIKEGVNKMIKTTEQFVQFSQGNVEAMVKSSQIMASGFQEMTKLMASHAQSSLDHTMSTFKAMTGVKSIKEVLDIQAAFARDSMEKAMTESGKLTEHSMKLAEQALAPISARVNAAVETFTTH